MQDPFHDTPNRLHRGVEFRPLSSATLARSTQAVENDQDESKIESSIFIEHPHVASFKAQRLNGEIFEETFAGAFNVLATLNPDRYFMPPGVS